MRFTILSCARAAAAIVGVSMPSAASAAEQPLFLNAPSSKPAPSPRLAVQFALDLRLPEGRGLARALIEAGVDQDDAGRAAKLAAGHLGEQSGGCAVRVSISKGVAGTAFRLVRVTLTTQGRETVIERRGADLAIAAQGSLPQTPRFV